MKNPDERVYIEAQKLWEKNEISKDGTDAFSLIPSLKLSSRNHVDSEMGPWVVGLYESLEKFLLFSNRTGNLNIPLYSSQIATCNDN